MTDPMQEIRASFFIECEELLEALQDALQTMEGGDNSSEIINVAFRAVHSIKGGAGAFGLDDLVAFAHRFETAMDEVRAGRLVPDAACLALFFQGGDALSDLVRAARDDTPLDASVTAPLLAQLDALVGADGAPEVEEHIDFQPMGISLDLPGISVPGLPPLGAPSGAPEVVPQDLRRDYYIEFVPELELYKSGNEPLYLLRALGDLGATEVDCVLTATPDLGDYSAAQSLMAWTIHLRTEADADAIREVFEFVEGLCKLEITAPAVRPESTAAAAAPTSTIAPADPAAAPPPVPTIEDAPKTEAVPSAPEASSVVALERPAAAPAPARAATPAAARPPAEPAQAATPQGATVRVDLERIDRLVNLVGELVINQAMLTQSFVELGIPGNTAIATGLDEFQQLTRDIQDSVMMIRAQPVKSLFQRMARIVREASAAVDKTVRFHTEGEATEIDKTVIERLADPLTHMIRNAVDHGLETSEDRIAAGKGAEGHVTLKASHRSGRVVIDVSDDGGGINRPRVRQIAIDKGLIPEDQDLSDSDIDNLLFLPGFSTAKEISNLSGRGVGMDVVKNAIGSLGGRITITSTPGQGTTFSISLPLTLAVLDGMVVKVQGETLVVPLSAVSETLSLQPGDARPLGPRTQVIRVRDSFVPLVDLGTELGYSTPRECYDGAIVLLIQHEDGSRAALVVDDIEDQRQVVIKGLHESYGHVPGVAAATILGDGQIALILDPVDLISNASGLTRAEQMLAKAG